MIICIETASKSALNRYLNKSLFKWNGWRLVQHCAFTFIHIHSTHWCWHFSLFIRLRRFLATLACQALSHQSSLFVVALMCSFSSTIPRPCLWHSFGLLLPVRCPFSLAGLAARLLISVSAWSSRRTWCVQLYPKWEDSFKPLAEHRMSFTTFDSWQLI